MRFIRKVKPACLECEKECNELIDDIALKTTFKSLFQLTYHVLAIAFVGANLKAANEAARQHQAAYHHHLYGDYYGVDSKDDYGDVDVYQVPTGLVMSCMFDWVSTCHHPMNVAMTSMSFDLNCETKDLLKLDICL
ncbi:CLUMA_CG018530, isoform A [Clunio marinus]|uniref:CLUMA_CG018530, isoform A n=1 Tax=Clunio marinus TaxID=568069 RepID=A0A1J1IY04_9DIPT|nr:CLUMA_CG018530, isoform A [Clunio marinus]